MKLSDINPHIRYATIHYNLFEKPYDSICYDCRLFYAKNAQGTCVADGIKYQFSNNTVIFLPPGTRYHLYISKDCDDSIFVVIDFDLINDFCHISKSLGTANTQNFIPEQVITYPLPQEFSSPFVKNAPDLFDLLTKCCDEFLMQNNLFRESASALLKLCLIELVRKYTQNTELQKVAPVLEYLHANYQNSDLTNEYIAQIFNYHPYYLSQLFKQCTGKTLHQYLIQYRIKIAKKNLITTDDAINIIAWKSGFHSVAYFIKIFKEQVGVTPKIYRKEHMQFLF